MAIICTGLTERCVTGTCTGPYSWGMGVGGEEYDVEEVGEDEDSVLDEGWDGNLPPAARAVLVCCYTMCEQVEDKSRVHRFFCQEIDAAHRSGELHTRDWNSW